MSEHKSFGSLVLVLHAHLPYVVSHGSWPHGTDWLNEAAAETYLPILQVLNELAEEGVSARITMGLTPVLVAQLAHPDFQRDFPQYLQMKQQYAQENEKEFSHIGSGHLVELAQHWQRFYRSLQDDFLIRYERDLVGAFRKLQDAGHIEIITSAATHGYLPLLGQDTNVQAQIKMGIASYEKHFGRRPKGFWLPECAYRPRYEWQAPVGADEPATLRKGIEEFLSENQLDYFITDAHLLAGGEAIGAYMERFEALKKLWEQAHESQKRYHPRRERTPYQCYLLRPAGGGQPVAVFVRDSKSAFQVWSGAYGYPGDHWYLDFHKKHFPGGHRYWRVTDDSNDLGTKREYELPQAEGRVEENASHFCSLVGDLLRQYHEETGERGVVCAPFDAELLGHWWFEGPRWLKSVIVNMKNRADVELETCSEYLASEPPVEVVRLAEGSWGEGGFHWIWLNQSTQWTWKHIYEDEARYSEILAQLDGRPEGELLRVLKQLARELLLLESSDWQFLISTWSGRDYAENRFQRHHADFGRLADLAEKLLGGKQLLPAEVAFLSECEARDNLFDNLEIEWWCGLEHPVTQG